MKHLVNAVKKIIKANDESKMLDWLKRPKTIGKYGDSFWADATKAYSEDETIAKREGNILYLNDSIPYDSDDVVEIRDNLGVEAKSMGIKIVNKHQAFFN